MSERANAPEGWWREFVFAPPPRTAKLAVVAKDGHPLVAPVWVALDGDDFLFTTARTPATTNENITSVIMSSISVKPRCELIPLRGFRGITCPSGRRP